MIIGLPLLILGTFVALAVGFAVWFFVERKRCLDVHYESVRLRAMSRKPWGSAVAPKARRKG